jgi:hypothetical protein
VVIGLGVGLGIAAVLGTLGGFFVGTRSSKRNLLGGAGNSMDATQGVGNRDIAGLTAEVKTPMLAANGQAPYEFSEQGISELGQDR